MDALGLDAASSGSPPVRNATLGQEDFLRLLTTQLTSQSPLDPMDNQAFVAQMAQFSSVSGIAEMNESVRALRSDLANSRLGDAAAFVGRTALVPAIDVRPDGPVSGTVALPEDAQGLLVEVRDAAGAVVRRIDLGATEAGDAAFVWDGRDARGDPAGAGPFRLSATARTSAGEAPVPLYVNGRVAAVAVDGGTTVLTVDGIGDIAADRVRALS